MESGAVFSDTSEDGVGSGLVVELEAINSIGGTRLIKRNAVKNAVCNTPKSSSVSARYEIEKQIRTWRSWFEGASEDLNYKVLPGAVRHCAWADDTPSREIRRARTTKQGTGARVRRGESFQIYTEGCGNVKNCMTSGA